MEYRQAIPVIDDPIPLNAIRLSGAFTALFDAIQENPRIAAEHLDPRYLITLERLRETDSASPNLLSDEVDFHYADRAANFLIRDALTAGRLTASVRDPDFGEVLQLRSSDWVPPEWLKDEAEMPPYGMLSDFINEDFSVASENPFDFIWGPGGSIIRGFRRPVFFMRDQFDKWMNGIVGRTTPSAQVNSPAKSPARRKAHRREGVKEAIKAIWDTSLPPNGVASGARDREINTWLVKMKRTPVDGNTIKRAIAELRADR
jgi:hypothetical protein